MSGNVVLCPVCPMCGTAPPFIYGTLHQAWCPNEDCEVLFWVPWDTAAQNLADMHQVEIHESNPEAEE